MDVEKQRPKRVLWVGAVGAGLPSFCLLLCAQRILQPESRHSMPQKREVSAVLSCLSRRDVVGIEGKELYASGW